MTRPDIAAALERLAMCNRINLADAAICKEAARLLRAADQPAELSNNPGELPATAAPDESYRLPETLSLKCQPPYFAAILSGEKTFEIRKNDRGYRVGDRLHLREWDDEVGEYTGREQTVDVLYRMPGGRWGIAPDHCVMAIRLVHPAPAAGEDEALLKKMREAKASVLPYGLIGASDVIGESASRLRALREERDTERKRADQAVMDRRDALSVKSRDGLLSSEWIARTGKAERERDEARAALAAEKIRADDLAAWVDHYRTKEASALARAEAAESATKAAVKKEREICAVMCERHGFSSAAALIRARAAGEGGEKP